MNCPHPIYRFPVSPSSLRSLGYISDRSNEFLGKRPHKGAYFFNSDQINSIPLELRDNIQPIGCGHCLACRLQYASEWALRLQLEASLYPHNLFLTLTFDDDHLSDSFFVDDVTGEFHLSELQKLDVSRFMKRLRFLLMEKFNFTGVRFFASGEYGDKTDRPHYHVILLNLPSDIFGSFVFLSKTPRGDFLYRSDLFDSIWKKGFVTIGRCSPESIGYVTRYSLKKVSAFERLSDRQEPFALMSRNPGIGAPYFYKYRDIIESTGKVVVTSDGHSSVVSAPSYFLYLIKNAPIRAHRLPDSLHYDPGVLDAERKALSIFNDLKDQGRAALDHVNDRFTADLLNLPRPGSDTSVSRLNALQSNLDILQKKHKRYTAKFKSL